MDGCHHQPHVPLRALTRVCEDATAILTHVRGVAKARVAAMAAAVAEYAAEQEKRLQQQHWARSLAASISNGLPATKVVAAAKTREQQVCLCVRVLWRDADTHCHADGVCLAAQRSGSHCWVGAGASGVCEA